MGIRILGINFRTDGSTLPARLNEGGLVVAPSGPGLACDLPVRPAYRQALQEAEWVLPDSGLMVIVWNFLHLFNSSARIQRYSGLRLLREILPRSEVQSAGASFWIMPSAEDRDRNLKWLQNHGYAVLSEQDCYVAPHYIPTSNDAIQDKVLLGIIEQRRPMVVFVNVGGGVQEQLGWYLRRNLSFCPTILCTGAAIAFLTGGQAAIPPWADRLYLGWFLRVMRNPLRFGTRYGSSWGLVAMILRYRDGLPKSCL